MSEPRFPVIDPQDMTPEQKAVADRIASGPRGGVRGPFIALLHHPQLANVVQQVGEQLRFNATISEELVEFAILLVSRKWTCQYEWVAHERIARTKTTLPDALIKAVQVGAVPEGMNDDQRVVYDFVVRTLRHGSPANDVYTEAEQRFGRQGVLDLIAICGYYSLLAMVLNTAELALPEGTLPPLRALQI